MKKNIFLKLLATTLTISILLLTGCSSSKEELYEKSNIIMDAPIKLTAYGPNAKKAVEESFVKLNAIDNMANPNIKTSDVTQINQASGKNFVKVHPEIMKMVKASVKYAKLSDGAFDITVGPLINLWNIGTDKERIPSDNEIKAKMSLVGYDNINIDETTESIMLQKEGMAIDLGGIAKGFAADQVLQIYKKYNITKGIINLGSSSIYTLGKNDENKAWAIGIKNPRDDNPDNLLGIVRISDEALSTSGDYERFFIQNGKRYHHILNPKTGYPADTGIMSDTIVVKGIEKDSSMIADILTTTVFVLGPEKGLNLVKSLPNVSCEITTTDFKISTSSSNFQKRINSLNKSFKFVQ